MRTRHENIPIIGYRETRITVNTYIMLFRGINVGGRNILPMKNLVNLLETCGFGNVKTYIQSGNVVVDAHEKPDDSVRLAIESTHGFSPDIMIFEKNEFQTMIKNNPFTSDIGKTIHFFFCEKRPNPDLKKLEQLATATERFEIRDNVFYLHAPDGIGRSKLAGKVEACLGVSTTARNLNTVSKLLEMTNHAR